MNITSSSSRILYLLLWFYTRILLFTALLIRRFKNGSVEESIIYNSYNGKAKDLTLEYLLNYMPSHIKVIRVGENFGFYSLTYFKYLVSSKYWLTNTTMLYTTSYKPSHVKAIYTWHGTPLVNAGNAVSSLRYYDFSKVDIFFVRNKYEINTFQKYFNIGQNYIEAGGLRESVSRIKVPGSLEKNLLFYAPSWRTYQFDDYGLDLSVLAEICKRLNLTLVVSIHHKTGISSEFNVSDVIFLEADVDRYHVLRRTKIFISDYSSLIADAVEANCQVYMFIKDFVVVKKNRGFMFDSMQQHIYIEESSLFADLLAGVSNFGLVNMFKSEYSGSPLLYLEKLANE